MYEGRKADALHPAEGSSPRYAIGDVPRTPPGSETRACIHGGSLGTWEVQMLPCVRRRYKEIQRKAKSRRWGGMSRPSTSPALKVWEAQR